MKEDEEKIAKDKAEQERKKACEESRCPWHQWGNSVLAVNVKYWTCTYCGNLLVDNKPFQIVTLNMTLRPGIFCSETCMILEIRKLEVRNIDKDK